MKLKEIRAAEWAIALLLFGVLIGYIFWGYNIERYEKFMRAGAVNQIIWRALNADAMGIRGDLSGMSDEELGIGANPVLCETSLGNTRFPAKCRVFDPLNGGKAVNCDYWWLGRNCRIVYISKDVYESSKLRNRIFTALQSPCRVLADPYRVKTGKSAVDEINTNFWSGFGCSSRFNLWPVETLVFLKGKNSASEIRRILKRN